MRRGCRLYSLIIYRKMGRCFLCQEDTELQCQNGHFYCCDDHLEAHGPCFPFEVVISEEFGRYFVATRDIKPLELVVVDEPALVGPATKTRPVCLECFSGPLSADSSDLCEQCQFPLCKSCSTSDDKRRFHREEECKILAGSSLAKEVTFERDDMKYACIFLLRMCLLRDANPGVYKRLNYLMDGNTQDLMDENSFSSEIAAIMRSKMGLTGLSREAVVRLMGIKRTNASTLASVGIAGANAIYPVYNLMNSFCTCNTRCTIDAKTFKMIVRAQSEIKKGQQITTRYVPPWEGQPKRLSQIWKQWQFICCCDRCKDPTEFGTCFSAIKCKKCPSGYLLPFKPNKIASPWVCGGCDAKTSHSEVLELLANTEVMTKEWTAKQPPQNWPELLIKLQETLHPNHYIIFGIKKALVTKPALADNNSIESLERKLRYCQEVMSIVEKLDPGLTMQRALLLKSSAEAHSEMARLLKSSEQQANYAEEHTKAAVENLKAMTLCLKYPKTI